MSFKTFLPKKKSILHVYYMQTMPLFINIGKMIIPSDFIGIKFKFKRFYVSKLQNLKFLLQILEAFLNFAIQIFYFIHMLP